MKPRSRGRDTGWAGVAFLIALAISVALTIAIAPVAAQPQDVPPPGEPEEPYGGEPEDPYGGEPEDPYGGEPEDPYGDRAGTDAPSGGDDASAEGDPEGSSPDPDEIDPNIGGDAAGEDAAGGDIDTAVAQALYQRAGVLFDNEDYENARMLLMEALARNPKGQTRASIGALLRETETLISEREVEENIPVDPYESEENTEPDDALDPWLDEQADDTEIPTDLVVADTSVAEDLDRGRRTFILYGGMLGLTVGLALNDFDSADSSPVVPSLLGAGVGLGGAYLLARNREFTSGQASTIAWSGAWSGLVGGVIADLAVIDDSSVNEVMRAVALSAMAGTAVGWYAAPRLDPSPGDAALVNSMGLYGTGIGLLIGVGIDPVESEAYSLNAAIGAGLGLASGLYLASQTDVSRRRMMWVDLGAAVGAAAPWVLLYPVFADSSVRSDEQAAGVLSAVGMVAGGYLAWRLTRGIEPERIADDGLAAGPGLIRRSDDGRWGFGIALPQPVFHPSLGPHLGGLALAVDIVGGRF